jgi:hypothetical protein
MDDVIISLQQDVTMRERLCNNPMLLHECIITINGKWREYLKWLGVHAADNDLAMVGKPENMQQASSFRQLQRLRHTKDLIITARACCVGNSELLIQLIKMFGQLSIDSAVLGAYKLDMKSYIQSTGVLEQRIQNLTELVSVVSSYLQLES